jgi:hypothetical protein
MRQKGTSFLNALVETGAINDESLHDLLSEHFLALYVRKNQRVLHGFTRETMELLTSYHWPGNIRELENVVNHMVSVENSNVLNMSYLMSRFVLTETTLGLTFSTALMVFSSSNIFYHPPFFSFYLIL